MMSNKPNNAIKEKSLFTKNLDVLLIVIFLISAVLGFVLEHQIFLYLAMSFAIIGSIVVQQPDIKGNPDEREKFINYRAASYAFFVSLTCLIFYDVFVIDLLSLGNDLAPGNIVSGIITVLFFIYTATHSIMKRIY